MKPPRPLLRTALATLTMAAMPWHAGAQTSSWVSDVSHVVIPQTPHVSFRGTAPVELVGVEARVKLLEGTATTTVQLHLRNRSATIQESVLLMPVPDGAAVSSFLFDGPAAEPTAELMPREEARRIYDQIVARARDPALLEFAGYNLIRSSVFPVPANGEQKVRLTYEQILDHDGDRVDYVLPRSESLAHQVPWNITVDVKSREPISMVYSPSHEVKSAVRSPNHHVVSVEGAAAVEPGSFRLSYLAEKSGWSASLLAYPDPAVGGGYFLLMAGAPRVGADMRIKREVTVVLDRSGSMAGGKLDQALAAAVQIIEGLADGEAFNIIAYSTAVSMFAKGPVIKSPETIEAAREYLKTIRPTGGTNIHDALLEALRQPAVDGTLPMVLFLTDGLPTIGRTSEVAIRDLVESANEQRRRVFTFGVGEDVNVPLLDRLADVTRATATYILPGEDVELKVARVFRRLYGPVYADLSLATLDGEGAETTRRVDEIIPSRLPDLFQGDQLIVLGQYRGEDPLTFELGGNLLGDSKRFRFTFDLDKATTRNAFVARLWASRRIAFLVDEIRQAGAAAAQRPATVGEDPLASSRYRELIDEILRLSTEFGVLTEYTAFLAREGTDLSDWGEMLRGCYDNLSQRAVYTRAGKGALNQGVNFNNQKVQWRLNYKNGFLDQNLERVEIGEVQQVCDRAFFHQGGRWIDSRLVAEQRVVEPKKVVTFGSEEHRELLTELIEQGRQGVLSLRGDIVLKHGTESVLIQNGYGSK